VGKVRFLIQIFSATVRFRAYWTPTSLPSTGKKTGFGGDPSPYGFVMNGNDAIGSVRIAGRFRGGFSTPRPEQDRHAKTAQHIPNHSAARPASKFKCSRPDSH
jgi:hypothetical protein